MLAPVDHFEGDRSGPPICLEAAIFDKLKARIKTFGAESHRKYSLLSYESG
jgi:hypothetical protein